MSSILYIIFILSTFHSHIKCEQIGKPSAIHIAKPMHCHNCYQVFNYTLNPIVTKEFCPPNSWRRVECPVGSSCFTKITKNSFNISIHKSCVLDDLQDSKCLSKTSDDEVLFCKMCSSEFCNTQYATCNDVCVMNTGTSDFEMQRKVWILSQVAIFVLTALMF